MNHQQMIRILIAEDDYLIGRSTAVLLERMGYTVVGQALDGRQAVEMTQSLRPDVILMDIKMPVMDGVEATRHIYETCPTPVVALTAYDTPEVIERAIAAGMGAYLTKPASPHQMERAINVTIARFDDMVKLRRLNTKLQAEITERKRAEEELDRIFNLSLDMLCIFGFDGYARRLNPAFEKTLGYTAEEILAKPFLEFVHPEDRPATIARLQELAIGTPVIYGEQRCRCKDGSYKWLAWTITPVVEEGLMYAAAHDITERKQIEDALRESEERFRGIFENATVGLYRTTPDGRILMANPALVHMLGYSSFEELAQRNLEESGYETEYPRSAFKERVESEGQVIGLESVWVKQDGATLFVRESAKAICDEAGNTLCYEGTVEDITDRKRAEEETRQRNRELAALNAAATTIMQSTLNLDEVLQRIADGVVEGLGCNTAAMLLLDEKEGVFKSGAVSTRGNIIKRINALIGFPLTRIRFPARSDFNETVRNALDGRMTIKHDLYELVGPTFSRPICFALQRLLGSKTFLGLPLLARGKVVGGIFASTAREELSEGDIETMTTFANQAAIAIENARLYQETRQRALEQETLREAALALTTALDRNQVIERILAQLQQVVPYDSASVQLLREDRMEIVGGRGFPNLPDLLGISFPADGDNPNSEVIRTRAPFIVEDAPAVYGVFQKGPHAQTTIRSWLGVPMLIGEQLVGMIALDKRELGFYTQEHARLAEAFAAQAAIAVENAHLFEEEKRRSAQLALINEAGEKAASILDLDKLMQEVAHSIRERFNYYNVELILLDEERGELVLRAIAGGFEHVAPGDYRQSIDEGIMGFVARTGQSRLASDVSKDPYYIEGFLEPMLTESELCVPIKLGDKVIGVLDVQSVRLNAFDQADVVAMEAVADRVAIGIENARLFEEVEEQRLYLAGVLRDAPDAIVTLDAHHRVVEWNPGAERLFGYSQEEAVGQNIDLLVAKPDVLEEAVRLTQMVMGGGEVPPAEAVRYRKDGSPVDVIVAGSPILVGDEFIGAVAVYTNITERVRMEETLLALSLIDELTGLYNRRGFLILAEQQLKTAKRAKRRMMLLFADFDGLKRINDAFGHPEGDRALIETADILTETFRESDIVARIAGDEFVVLAIETDGFPAEVLTTRLQENLEARNAGEGRRYKLSLSVGLARYDPEHPCFIDELLAQADRAMYEHKRRRGRR